MTLIAGREINFGLWYDFRNPAPWTRPVAEWTKWGTMPR